MFHNTKMAQLTKEIEEAVKKLLDLFPELSSIKRILKQIYLLFLVS
jgi:hypothetical protein